MSGALDAFLAGSGELCHADYWGRLAAVWRAAGADERRDPRWARAWEQAALAPGSDRGLMTDDERAALAALPERIAVRRAGEAWRPAGGAEATATVARDDVVALFATGGETELVVLDRDVAQDGPHPSR